MQILNLTLLLVVLNSSSGFTFLGNFKVPSITEFAEKFEADKKFGNKKVCVITGTSSGLGKHTTKQLLKDGIILSITKKKSI